MTKMKLQPKQLWKWIQMNNIDYMQHKSGNWSLKILMRSVCLSLLEYEKTAKNDTTRFFMSKLSRNKKPKEYFVITTKCWRISTIYLQFYKLQKFVYLQQSSEHLPFWAYETFCGITPSYDYRCCNTKHIREKYI